MEAELGEDEELWKGESQRATGEGDEAGCTSGPVVEADLRDGATSAVSDETKGPVSYRCPCKRPAQVERETSFALEHRESSPTCPPPALLR